MFAPSVDHPSLPELLNVIAAPHGPMLVYKWVPGELLGVEHSRRAEPATSFQRFRALPLSDLITRLDVVFDFHRSAAELGWVAVNFYDGAMIYDFATQAMRLIDLDHYRDRPFTEAGPAQMSLAEELSGIETLFLGAYVSVSRELGLAPDTAHEFRHIRKRSCRAVCRLGARTEIRSRSQSRPTDYGPGFLRRGASQT
jgi:hypothetical protein